MKYAEILKAEGSFRKAAKVLNLSKAQFVKFWKRELGLCERRTSCNNKPKPGATLCQECSDYLSKTSNKELKKENHKNWKEQNREYVRKKAKENYYKNHKKRREYANAYYKGKKVYNEKAARRRASKKQACPSWVDKNVLKGIYKNCPEGSHVDHIIPLQHEEVCGLHVPWNLQYLTGSENDSKGNQWDGTYDNNSWRLNICHQFRKRLETESEDRSLGYNFDLQASDFSLQVEPMSKELSNFIARYEWLGNTGWSIKWAFTARHEGKLAGVVLIANPTKPSNFVNNNREALIQRGAAASWAPKNLNSRLVMFACKWMVANTDRRVFVAYSDPEAGEIGTIYQACNFRYLGASFGRKQSYVLESGKKVSARYFTRSSSMRKWARQLGITWDASWNKANGFQDLNAIPAHIKSILTAYARQQKANCVKVETQAKGKYMLVLGKDRKEQKLLNKEFESYKSEAYPKRELPKRQN